MIKVREATPEDWPAVSSLLVELGRPDGRESVEHRDGFEKYVRRSDAVALVGVIDRTVAGFCDIEFRSRLNYTTPEAWIPELVVAASSRGKGSAKRCWSGRARSPASAARI